MIKHDFFDDLLKSIFGISNVMIKYYSDEEEYNDKEDYSSKELSFTPVIMRDGKWFSDIKYNAYHQKKYENLFFHALCDKKTNFENDHNERKIGEREKVLARTKVFLSEYGFNLSDDVYVTIGCEAIRRTFFAAFRDVILPIVFENIDKYEEFDRKNDLIKNKLQALFSGFELGYIVHNHAKMKDFEIIYDSEYKFNIEKEIGDDLYAVPIDRSKIESDIIIPCSIAAISFGVKNNTDSDRFSFNSIIGNYHKYPFKDDEPFVDPFVWQADNFSANSPIYTRASYFPLSSCSIPNQYFIPRYFYYITRINEDIINKYNEGRSEFDKIDHDKLNDLLMLRAVNDFRLKHNGDISKYYSHVMTYVEDMIRRIATADYSFFIRGDRDDVEACQRFTRHFNIDYGKIIEFIEDDDCIAKCYELIENAILSFVSYLETNTSRLAEELKAFQPYDVVSHYNSIVEYIESRKLLHAVELKSEKLSENANYYMQLETPDKDEEGHISIFDTFKLMGQRKKANNTYEYIYNVLKNYHETLGRVINDER